MTKWQIGNDAAETGSIGAISSKSVMAIVVSKDAWIIVLHYKESEGITMSKGFGVNIFDKVGNHRGLWWVKV